LTLELNLGTAKPNQQVKHLDLDKGYLVQKLLSGHTDTHRTDCSIWTTKVVDNMNEFNVTNKRSDHRTQTINKLMNE